MNARDRETLWTVCSNLETIILAEGTDFPESFKVNLGNAFEILRKQGERLDENNCLAVAANLINELTVNGIVIMSPIARNLILVRFAQIINGLNLDSQEPQEELLDGKRKDEPLR